MVMGVGVLVDMGKADDVPVLGRCISSHFEFATLSPYGSGSIELLTEGEVLWF